MQALYIVVKSRHTAENAYKSHLINQSYDYSLEKVKLYTRVPLQDVIGISKGQCPGCISDRQNQCSCHLGAYILSPLEEASRDPDQNAGFIVTWINSNQESRATSYCVRNSLHPIDALPSDASLNAQTTSAQPQTWSVRTNTRKPTRLLAISFLAAPGVGEKTFMSFTTLPIDPARMRHGSTTTNAPYAETSEEVAGALNCREVVDRIVDSINRACQDSELGQGVLVAHEDVVGYVTQLRGQ